MATSSLGGSQLRELLYVLRGEPASTSVPNPAKESTTACNQHVDTHVDAGCRVGRKCQKQNPENPHVEVTAGLSRIFLTNQKVTPQGQIQVRNNRHNLKRQEKKSKYGCEKDNLEKCTF